jgi:hypothetical protein
LIKDCPQLSQSITELRQLKFQTKLSLEDWLIVINKLLATWAFATDRGLTSGEYQLHSSIRCWDGKRTDTLAVNGEFIEIDEEFYSYKQAKRSYMRKRGEEPKHMTKWYNDFPFEVSYCSLVGVDTHFVKLLLNDSNAYLDELERRNAIMIRERNSIKIKYGDEWKKYKTDEYNNSIKSFMELSNGVVRARHKCSTTTNRCQGQSVECVYIMVDEVNKNKSLMYVALSRAIHKIVLVVKNELS